MKTKIDLLTVIVISILCVIGSSLISLILTKTYIEQKSIKQIQESYIKGNKLGTVTVLEQFQNSEKVYIGDLVINEPNTIVHDSSFYIFDKSDESVLERFFTKKGEGCIFYNNWFYDYANNRF